MVQSSCHPLAQGSSILTLGCDPLPISLNALVCLILKSRDLLLKLVVPLSGLPWGLNLFQE